MFEYYNNLLINKTKFLDPRILDTDLFLNSRVIYLNQNKIPCECVVEAPNLVMFKYKFMKNVGYSVKHEVLRKNVIKMQGDYCLTYTEARQFNTKHNLVNLDINVEFMYGEKISIMAYKKDYGVLLTASHSKVMSSDGSYSQIAHIPVVGVSNFSVIPFGEIFSGCFPETVGMFEDFYSSDIYTKKL